jgi:tetratricopeptide (TPR) repeat protein
MRIAVALLLLTTLSTRTQAQDVRSARQHFEQGSSLYDLGKFREAAREYEEAYKLKNDPALLFNIGQAYRGAGADREAVTAYRSYLRKVPDAPNRGEVEAHIARLQKKIDQQQQTAPPPVDNSQRTQQQQQQANPQLTTTTTTSRAERPPLYKRWWLWTAVGGAVVAGAVVAIAVAYTTPKDAPAPPGALTVTF